MAPSNTRQTVRGKTGRRCPGRKGCFQRTPAVVSPPMQDGRWQGIAWAAAFRPGRRVGCLAAGLAGEGERGKECGQSGARPLALRQLLHPATARAAQPDNKQSGRCLCGGRRHPSRSTVQPISLRYRPSISFSLLYLRMHLPCKARDETRYSSRWEALSSKSQLVSARLPFSSQFSRHGQEISLLSTTPVGSTFLVIPRIATSTRTGWLLFVPRYLSRLCRSEI